MNFKKVEAYLTPSFERSFTSELQAHPADSDLWVRHWMNIVGRILGLGWDTWLLDQSEGLPAATKNEAISSRLSLSLVFLSTHHSDEMLGWVGCWDWRRTGRR